MIINPSYFFHVFCRNKFGIFAIESPAAREKFLPAALRPTVSYLPFSDSPWRYYNLGTYVYPCIFLAGPGHQYLQRIQLGEISPVNFSNANGDSAQYSNHHATKYRFRPFSFSLQREDKKCPIMCLFLLKMPFCFTSVLPPATFYVVWRKVLFTASFAPRRLMCEIFTNVFFSPPPFYLP